MSWKMKLLEKWGVKSIGGGAYREGFVDGLSMADKRIIVLEEQVKILQHCLKNKNGELH